MECRLSLHAVYEVDEADFDNNEDWARLGLPADWVQIRYTIEDDDLAASYLRPDSRRNFRGTRRPKSA